MARSLTRPELRSQRSEGSGSRSLAATSARLEASGKANGGHRARRPHAYKSSRSNHEATSKDQLASSSIRTAVGDSTGTMCIGFIRAPQNHQRSPVFRQPRSSRQSPRLFHIDHADPCRGLVRGTNLSPKFFTQTMLQASRL